MSKTCHECEKNKVVLPYEYFANPLTIVEQGGDWIQGAIKHPGRCTPGSPNYDCPKGSPQWNLAQRFKHGDLHKAQNGGNQQSQIIQVIKMYAKLHNTQPELILQKLQQLDENGQQQALQSMVSEIQQGGAQQQDVAPTSYANNDEAVDMQSYQTGGAYDYQQTGGKSYQGYAGGFGNNGPDYIAPAIHSTIGDSKLLSPLKAVTGYMGLGAGLAASGLGWGKSAQWLGNKVLPDGEIKNGFNGVMNAGNDILKNIVDIGVSGSTRQNTTQQRPGFGYTPMSYNEFGGTLPKHQFAGTTYGNAGMMMDDGSADYNAGYQSVPTYVNTGKTGAPGFAEGFGMNAQNGYGYDNNGAPSYSQTPENTSPQLCRPGTACYESTHGHNASTKGTTPITPTAKSETPSAPNKPGNAQGSFNGMEYAQKGLVGLGTFNSYLDYKNNQNRKAEYEDMLKRVGNTDFRLASNGPNPYGDYTLNVGPSNNFQLGMTTPIQDFGTKGPSARYGGSMNQSYKEGGEYQVSEEELLQLMQNGAEIEFFK
jgi:hypothetical protein